MKILELEFRNFNSYGNVVQTIDLRDPNFYLLFGASGVGKSTIREVIGYLLYGKVDGKNMGDLPNRINRKDLWGRILLEANNSVIEIKRGMKPNIFEVIIDGKPEDTAGKKNIQDLLETEYYKIPQSTYNNVVTISIDKFKSFLKMTPKDKKKIIDQIFSFMVFNKVYEKLNRKVLDYNTELKSINKQILVLTDSKNDVLKKIEAIKSTKKDQIVEKLKGLAPKIKTLQEESKKFEAALDTLKEKQDLIAAKNQSISREVMGYEQQIRVLENKLKLYSEDKCPECSSDLTSDYHKGRKQEFLDEKAEIEKLKIEKQDILLKLKEGTSKVSHKRQVVSASLSKVKDELSGLVREFKITKASGEQNTSELDGILENTITKLDDLMNDLDDMSKEEHLYAEISKIFAEDGVKKQILKSVLPGLNQSVNEFTKKLHFPYRIEIDEKFDSVITSMGSEISVSTLSTGEHKKADFAVLIAIIKIMKRNFPGINLLFLDELLGNIDGHGIYELLSLTRKIVDELDMNVFVINHSELPSEIFDYKIEVVKKSGFSEMSIEKT